MQAEAIKCKCKNDLCQWERKGKPCDQFRLTGSQEYTHTVTGSETGSETGSDSEQFSIRRENGNLLNGQEISELTDENALSQLFRDIQLSNSGQMVFNINYYNNYYKNSTM